MDTLSQTSSGKAAAERLSVVGGGTFPSARLSNSCPSLNNDEGLENSINNNLQGARTPFLAPDFVSFINDKLIKSDIM